ncbi:MAG: ketopantoate reductase family protein [Betaproteobacteria bacterium]|nr:ketopantoate reductase family protein [Betaproteobacteria bacterium]
MRICIIGSGGVGGYFGGRLAASGTEVAFVARGAHLAALRTNGLRVESALGAVHVQPVEATDDPKTLGPCDLVIIAVKLWGTADAIDAAVPVMRERSAIVSLQNGVQAVRLLAERFGRERVLGGLAQISALIESPGVIRHNGTLQRLVFGELDGSRSARAEALLAACLAAGIDAHLSDSIERAIWEKFVFLVGLSATTTLTRCPLGPVRENPLTRALLLQVMSEAAALGRARGVALPEDSAERQLAFMDTLPRELVASMLGDLRRGNPLELEWLSGTVARDSDELGIPAPANSFVRAALTLHAGGGGE